MVNVQATIAPPPAADSQEIPDKLYFRIGEVSRLVGVKPYVLRYWESEFSNLAPKKSGTGHRLYRRKEVELLLEIKRLLYDKRFTIEGARKTLEGKVKPKAVPEAKAKRATAQGQLFAAGPDLSAIRDELRNILKLLQ
jgi:DNA-binding transcriptional MerR regulator